MEVITEGEYIYQETKGSSEVLVLLHGLFGATGNFKSIQESFKSKYNVVTPILPIMSMPLKKLSLDGLVDYVESFINYKGYSKVHLVGNSLGGHIAQLYTMRHPDKIKSITLTGSSGLFENAMGSTFPKRGDYEFIKKKAESTFYDPATATKEIIDEVFNTVNDRSKAIRVVVTAKSAVRNNLKDKIHKIKAPVLLVWGRQDSITPAWVGERFHEILPNSELEIIDKCGHAPMMERPKEFNTLLERFLAKFSVQSA